MDNPSSAGGHRPRLAPEDVERIRRWHEEAYRAMARTEPIRVEYLGRSFAVPPDVFPTTPMSELLGCAVLDEVRAGDRVLDMGTGCGVNAVLAAGTAREVLGVDINEHAVEAAIVNAALNGVTARTTFRYSDVFSHVDGCFDLIVFDPPFRWFRPRDALEAAIIDENYGTLRTFMRHAGDHFAEGGRRLIFFGTTGDMLFLEELIEENGFTRETVASRELLREDYRVEYRAMRLIRA